MESFWFRYGANYCNSQDNLSYIIRKFSKIVLLFFGFYEAHVLIYRLWNSLSSAIWGKDRGRGKDYF